MNHKRGVKFWSNSDPEPLSSTGSSLLNPQVLFEQSPVVLWIQPPTIFCGGFKSLSRREEKTVQSAFKYAPISLWL